MVAMETPEDAGTEMLRHLSVMFADVKTFSPRSTFFNKYKNN
jgi:hypothetical protein